MPEPEPLNKTNALPPRRPAQAPDEKPAEVDLEGLAREIWLLLKAKLREENDRLGRN